MKTVLYIHGFKSSGNNSKSTILRNSNINVISPTLDHNPTIAFNTLISIINDNRIDLIIGTSLGAFYGLLLNNKFNIPIVSINPSLYPHISLKEKIGLHTNYNTKKEFDWKIEHINSLYKLKTNYQFNYESNNIYMFLSTDDEILNHEYIPIMFKNSNTEFYDNSTHRFTRFIEIIPKIKNILNENND